MSYAGWKYYQYDGMNIGIKSPDGRQSVLLIDPEVSAWITTGNALLPADQPTLAESKTRQITAIEQNYLNTITSPILYLGTSFQADRDSQILLDHAIGKYTRQGSVPAGFWWKDAANNHISMTLVQLQGLADAIGDRIWINFQILDARKAAIRAATTIPQIQGIVW